MWNTVMFLLYHELYSKQYPGDLSSFPENKCACNITRHVEKPVESPESLMYFCFYQTYYYSMA